MLENTQGELEAALTRLQQIERKLERERDFTILALEKRAHGENKEGVSTPAPLAPTASAAPSPQPPGVKQDQAISEEARDVLEGSSGLTRTEIEELQAAAERREKELESVREEKRQLEHRTSELRIQIRSVPKAVVESSEPYKDLQRKLENAQKDLEDAKKALPEASENQPGEDGESDEKATQAKELSNHAAELGKKLSACMSDLARIRNERDIRTSELAEAKAKEGEKVRHVDQMRILAEARQVRIGSLVSEVYRLRMALAAANGDSALVTELAKAAESAKEPEDNASKPLPEEIVLHQTKEKLEEAERFAKTYREQLALLSGLSQESEDIEMAEQLVRDQANAIAERDAAKEKLAKLEQLLNEAGQPDNGKLLQRAEEAEKAAKQLEAKIKVAESVSSTVLKRALS